MNNKPHLFGVKNANETIEVQKANSTSTLYKYFKVIGFILLAVLSYCSYTFLIPELKKAGTEAFTSHAFGDFLNELNETRLIRANMSSGDLTRDRINQLKALQSKFKYYASTQSEAAYSDKLHIIIAEFDDKSGLPEKTDPAIVDNIMSDSSRILDITSDTRLIDLDFSQMGNSAFLIVSNRELILNISNKPPTAVAALAVENYKSVDITNSDGRIVAGLKIHTLGKGENIVKVSEVPNPSQPYKVTEKFCSSFIDWQEFFDVSKENISLWKVRNPQTLRLNEDEIQSDNKLKRNRKSLGKLCNA